MDDINFDELDKAVNSAMEPTAVSTATPADSSSEQSASITPNTTTPTPEVTSVTTPALPVKRRGQFMDIVHTSNSRMAPLPVANRHASTIKPLDPELIKVDGNQIPNNELVSASQPVNEQPKPVSYDTDSIAVEAEPATEPTSVVTTPFVEGVPVEKRPLGAFADNELPADEPVDVPSQDGIPSENQETIVAIPEPIKEEESATAAEVETAEAPDDKPFEANPTEPETYSVPAMPDEGTAQSIPQQYHVDNSFSNDEEHAVFDTSQYHQPLLPPAKPRHGHKVLMYVLLVVLLLAIGSAAGYAIFVLKLF